MPKRGHYVNERDKPMKFRSIRSRLIQFMLLATTIPLLLSISITYIHTKETIKEQALEENRHLIFQGKTNLSNYLDNINKASLVVYNDANFLRNLRKIPEDYRAVAEVFTLLQNIQNTVSGIERIYLHASQSNQSTLVTLSHLSEKGVPSRALRQYRAVRKIHDRRRADP